MQAREARPLGTPLNRGLRGLDRAVDALSQGVAGCLVAVEVVLLFAGVVGRYAFDHPLVWTDEENGVIHTYNLDPHAGFYRNFLTGLFLLLPVNDEL